MSLDLQATLVQALRNRCTGAGEFISRLGGDYRPDVAAWAILALQAAGANADEVQLAKVRLLKDQLPDGRLAVSPHHPEAYWPTSLAILAWNLAPECRTAQTKAVQFLLGNAGRHFKKQDDSPLGHDTTLRGWPWIEGTHAWVIPSALAVIALKTVNYSQHDRVLEAMRLLLDRQIPKGGWNYGNTSVYGQELHPMAESTGVALGALAGSIPRDQVATSLLYLEKRGTQVRTPLALSWSLLGLAAWNLRPAESLNLLEACWRRQDRFGAYDTNALSLMLLALAMPAGISCSA